MGFLVFGLFVLLFGAGLMYLSFGVLKVAESIGDHVAGVVMIAIGVVAIIFGILVIFYYFDEKSKKIKLRKKLSSTAASLIRDTLLLIFRVSLV